MFTAAVVTGHQQGNSEDDNSTEQDAISYNKNNK